MRRIAIVSSPRSGNTWVRKIIAGAMNIQEIAVHNYLDISGEIPEECVLQVHWYREPNFQKWLVDNGFKVVVVSRHPLDVLLSVLNFARYAPQANRWLQGNTEVQSLSEDIDPVSEEFLRFAMGFGFENLLSVSYQWWHEPSALKVRYEDCVSAPAAIFGQLIEELGGEAGSVPEFLERFSLQNMRDSPTRHGWQGRPGLYKELIPTFFAVRIYWSHRRLFQRMNYGLTPYFLSPGKAKALWQELSVRP